MKLTSFLFGLSLSFTALASCPDFDVPSNFKAKEALISIGTDVILFENKTRIGDIQERTLRLTPTFDLYNIDGKKVAQARQKILSLGSTIEVKDCEGKLIGTVRENIFKSFFSTYSNYDVLDASGKIIATSEKVELLATQLIVKSKKGELLMTIKRPMINVLTDTWTVNIVKKDAIDPRIMTMMPAFKTSADNRRREEEERKKK
ncbi:MAG: hypothetical protein ACLGHN_10450 [Bacteriovoracia bacterium]